MKKVNFQNDLLFFWIDALELYLQSSDIYDDDGSLIDFTWLNDSNTPFMKKYLNDIAFTITPKNPKWFFCWYQFSTVLDDTALPLFQINFSKNYQNENSTKRFVLVIYSTFFVIEKLFWFTIKTFIEKFFDPVDIRRVDIAIDVPYNVQFVIDKMFTGVHFNSSIWKIESKPWFYETYYIWDVKSDKNRNYVIRIYDKIKDSFKKWKSYLFPYLDGNNEVRRIEIEFRPGLCSRLPFTWQDLLSHNSPQVRDLFCSYYNKYVTTPFQLEYDKIQLIPYWYDEYNLKHQFKTLWFVPSMYVSRVKGYTDKVFEAWGFPALFQCILGIKKDDDWRFVYFPMRDSLEALDQFILFLKTQNISPSLLRKILKKHL
jgi:hypothetical protein